MAAGVRIALLKCDEIPQEEVAVIEDLQLRNLQDPSLEGNIEEELSILLLLELNSRFHQLLRTRYPKW